MKFSGVGGSENGEGQALKKHRIYRGVEMEQKEYGEESA